MTDVPADPHALSNDAMSMSVLSDDVGFQVHITRRALAMAHRAHKKRVTPSKPTGYLSTLVLIGANPNTTPQAISSALFLDTPNLTKILNLMDEEGLLKRTIDDKDRRRNTLTLTQAGHNKLDSFLTNDLPNGHLMAHGLSADEATQLCDLLRKVQIYCRDREER